MSPEEKEIEQMGAEVSARYRAGIDAEPSARVDAAILDAARREAARPVRRTWPVSAAVAAVLVLGVTLSLRMYDDLGTWPPPEAPGRSGADLAKPAAPGLEPGPGPDLRATPEAKQKAAPQPRLPRERSTRTDRESETHIARDALSARVVEPDRPAELESAPMAAAGQDDIPAAIGRAPAPALEKSVPRTSTPDNPATEESGAAESPAGRKRAQASMEQGRRAALQRKEESAVAGFADARTAEEWVRAIEDLLRHDRKDEARAQFAEFRRRFPGHRVPESLRELDREAGRP